MSSLDAFLKHFPDGRPVILTPDNFTVFSADPLRFMSML